MKALKFKNFINEIGIYSGDLTSLQIRALAKAKDTKSYKILNFIFEAGKEGVRYTDIIKFIVEELEGHQYDHSKHRGHWATNLLYTDYRGTSRGLLYLYCEKTDSGKWRLNQETLDFFNMENELYQQLSNKSRDFLTSIIKRKNN